jgi:hypothetical protein
MPPGLRVNKRHTKSMTTYINQTEDINGKKRYGINAFVLVDKSVKRKPIKR